METKQTILLLGGSPQQVIAIETAKQMGYHTVLCDYLPDNPGRLVADTFYLASTTDMERILQIAREEQVSGILAYASDPAAPTAAYVGEALGLPTNPYRAVDILCTKDKFRRFLGENGFAVPRAGGFSDRQEALAFLAELDFPVILKPVDSSGSKGVSVLYTRENAETYIDFAFSFSRSGRIVVEEFLEKQHPYLVGGDIFVRDGQVAVWGLLNCHRDEKANRLVPAGKSFPLDLPPDSEKLVKDTFQSLVTKLGIRNGPMNVELIIAKNGKPYIIDVGPRCGGNMIPDLLGDIFGINVVRMSIQCAMGTPVECAPRDTEGCYRATHNLHVCENGTFAGITYSREIEPHITRASVYKKEGDPVEFFDNAAKAVGILFLSFDSWEQMTDILEHIHEHVTIQLK